MQKTYWWRIILAAVSVIVLLIAFIGPCNFKLGRCLGGDSILITRTLFHIFLSIFVISPFLFFIQDSVFLKWLKFAIVWFVLASIFIAFAPVYTGGFVGFGPTKESVSIWMGSLFIILSLAQIIWKSRR